MMRYCSRWTYRGHRLSKSRYTTISHVTGEFRGDGSLTTLGIIFNFAQKNQCIHVTFHILCSTVQDGQGARYFEYSYSKNSILPRSSEETIYYLKMVESEL
ncbi:hypothetical protein TNCV_162131 [Trichonephila clavipes]|nr:hypothetical protein TNCV_162131 [Trichonephila clavipes]